MDRLVPVLGIGVLIGIAWAISTDRSRFPFRTAAWALALQALFVFFVLKSGTGTAILSAAADGVNRIIASANAGISLLFGPLADVERFGLILAVSALPSIVYIASVFAVLYHFGVLQLAVAGMARVMVRTLGTSGAETMVAAANVFMGQTEAPLVAAPYLEKMTRSELHAVMVTGMATVSGGMLAAYVALGVDARFLLAASVANAPAALLMAKIIVPETGTPATRGVVKPDRGAREANVIDAAARGASAGMKLLINVIAMVLAFLGLIALVDLPLGWVGLSLSQLLGWAFAPIAWLVGAPWADAPEVGALIGKKLITNEFVAYLDLVELNAAGAISERADRIASLALCGFANLGSIGILIGGLGAIAPSRKTDLARLGPRALVGGALASLLTAAVAGLIV